MSSAFTELQTLLQMLLDTAVVGGALAVGVIAGYGIYKLLTLASLLWFAKYCVEKCYELVKIKLAQGPPKQVTDVHLDKHIIRTDATPDKMYGLIGDMVSLAQNGLTYVHSGDVEIVRRLIREYRAKQNE